jgi:hypothetical protein
MSDFNPLDRAKIPTHRSSFDLSSKKLFTSKVGEILPCYWQIAIPNTRYRISSDWFTRTVPVNTAAYTRIKEYYDFYAVPLRLISRALPQAFTQMSDYMTSAASSTANVSALTSVPNVSQSLISLFLQTSNTGARPIVNIIRISQMLLPLRITIKIIVNLLISKERQCINNLRRGIDQRIITITKIINT